MQTLLFFHLLEMMRMHMSTLLQMKFFIQRIQMIYIPSQYSHRESVLVDEYAEPKKKPNWARTTLQDARDLVGDPADTRSTRSDFEKPPLALTTTELMPPRHIFLVQSLDPRSYGKDVGNPFWESSIQEEYNSLLDNQTWDLVPFPSRRKLVRCRWVHRTKSAVDG
jgi:hypothetical protein